MKRLSPGFTIIEVLIALAITGLLLTTASLVLKGQSTETTFQQSLRDIDTKIQTTVKAISNSLYPNTSQYTCSTVSGKATLTKEAGSGTGTNKDCLFLGKAFQVVLGEGTIKIYSVLGSRTTVDESGETVLAATFSQAKPTPAIIAGADLTESYQPAAGGAFLSKARYTDSSGTVPATETDMAGFYNDLEGTSTTDPQLLAKAYAYRADTAAVNKEAVKLCLEETGGCQSFLLAHWLLCYEDGNKRQTAVIDVMAASTGITTQLKFEACPN